jgi:hypothetical protein
LSWVVFLLGGGDFAFDEARQSATLLIGNMGHFPASGTPLLPRRCALTFPS